MATTAADGPPAEPHSLKKLSLQSMKRSMDLFSSAHPLPFTPDAESKRIRIGGKVRAEYGTVEDLAPEQARGWQDKGGAAPAPSSTTLALPGAQDTKDAHGEGNSNANVPAPLMFHKALESTIPGKNTTLSIPGSSGRFSTSALMDRIPSNLATAYLACSMEELSGHQWSLRMGTLYSLRSWKRVVLYRFC